MYNINNEVKRIIYFSRFNLKLMLLNFKLKNLIFDTIKKEKRLINPIKIFSSIKDEYGPL